MRYLAFIAALCLATVPIEEAEAGARVTQIATGQGAEHENTTTEGSIARKIFVANELSVGKVYMFDCGVEVNDNNSTDTLVIAVRFGSSSTVTSNTAVATSAAVDVADADQAVVRGWITVESTTRAVISVLLSEPDAIATISAKAHKTVVTIAPNTAYYLDVTADWSVAHADNEVAADSFSVIEFN
jgi:hypothetical protein